MRWRIGFRLICTVVALSLGGVGKVRVALADPPPRPAATEGTAGQDKNRDAKESDKSRADTDTKKPDAASADHHSSGKPQTSRTDRRRADQDQGNRTTDRDKDAGSRDERTRDRNKADRDDLSRDRPPRDHDADDDDSNSNVHDGRRDSDRDRDRNGDNDRDTARDRDSDTRDRDRDDRQDFGLSFSDVTENGITIDNIESSGIAARAGVRRGDVIRSVNGREIRSQDDFYRWINGRSGSRITVVLWRDGRWQTVYLQPQYNTYSTGRNFRNEMPAPRGGGAYLGVTSDHRYQNEAIIRYVFPNSAADRADLRPGEVILSVDGDNVESPDQLSELISQYQPGDEVELEVATNDDRTMTITVELGRRSTSRNNGYSQNRSYYQDESRAQDGRHYRDDRVQGAQYEHQPRRAPARSVLRSR